MANFITWMISMEFSKRLAELRKARHLTQQALADAIDINVSQLKRYEAGTSQPTLQAHACVKAHPVKSATSK